MTMIALYPACRPVSRRHYTAYASPRPDAYPGRPVAPAGFEKPGYATSGLKPDAKPLARPVASVFRSVRRLLEPRDLLSASKTYYYLAAPSYTILWVYVCWLSRQRTAGARGMANEFAGLRPTIWNYR